MKNTTLSTLWIGVAVSSIILLAGLGLFSSYAILIIWTLFLQGTLALSYDLLGGYGGELHLGHGTFFGLGAYVSAMTLLAGAPWWAALILSALGGYLFSLALRPLLVPLNGPAFSLASLVILLLCSSLFRNLDWMTGGVSGLSVPRTENMEVWFFSAFLLFLITLWIHDSIAHARFGRALRAVADDPDAAALSGIPCKTVKGKALVLGSVIGALAGGIFPLQSSYINLHAAFGLDVAMAPVIMVLLGGPGTRIGPLIGTVVFVGLQEWLWVHVSKGSLTMLGMGLILIGGFFPDGIAGLIKARR